MTRNGALGPALDKFQTTPLLELGAEAFEDKRARYGERVTYVRNRHVNPTNCCIHACKFCDFAAKPKDDKAFSRTEDEMVQAVSDPMLREVHIVGGLWPQWGFRRSLELIKQIRRARADLWIKAFTAVEIAYFATMERSSWDMILGRLREAGLDALPGGGAEVLSERVHKELYPDKIGPHQWLDIHETAHRMGIPTNATLLFGHIETDREIVEHLLQLRELEARAPGFQSFIPLAYQPGKTGLAARLVLAPRCLRVMAMARIMLDNIPHIKAYWPTLQIETAAAALSFGADDLDGTLGNERVMQMAGTGAPASLSTEFMVRMIVDAGQRPVERDGSFNEIDSESAVESLAKQATG